MTKKEMNNKILIVGILFLIIVNGLLAYTAYESFQENIPDQSSIIVFENCQSYENHDKKIDCFLENDIGENEELENWINRKNHYKITIINVIINSWAMISLLIIMVTFVLLFLGSSFAIIDKFTEY